jgi:hypothetical protein
MIQDGLNKLMRRRTIFVIEEGRIIERGNHRHLYALGGRYYDLYTRQHGLETNLFLAPGEGDDEADRNPDERVEADSPAEDELVPVMMSGTRSGAP